MRSDYEVRCMKLDEVLRSQMARRYFWGVARGATVLSFVLVGIVEVIVFFTEQKAVQVDPAWNAMKMLLIFFPALCFTPLLQFPEDYAQYTRVCSTFRLHDLYPSNSGVVREVTLLVPPERVVGRLSELLAPLDGRGVEQLVVGRQWIWRWVKYVERYNVSLALGENASAATLSVVGARRRKLLYFHIGDTASPVLLASLLAMGIQGGLITLNPAPNLSDAKLMEDLAPVLQASRGKRRWPWHG